ncbi:MAG: hypothetical protein GY754_33350 [bacterium]|nr:hypothetical protein [bacterium]
MNYFKSKLRDFILDTVFKGKYEAKPEYRNSPCLPDIGLSNFVKSSTIKDITDAGSLFINGMKMDPQNGFQGYLFSSSTDKPVLYNTLAVLLIKHLLGIEDETVKEELEYVQTFQHDDGIFRDSVVECQIAEEEDWWGWRHLTLHALMTLALYNTPAKKEIKYLEKFSNEKALIDFLEESDWGPRAAWTSNAVQNLGVMLQYSRDYHSSAQAGTLMDIVYDIVDKKQDKITGLYGDAFDTAEELSNGVQAGYHFWLLYLYDKRPINHIEKIIDNTLKTQNILGGYGVQLHSSACEDIDSIDPLLRFSRITDYRSHDIQKSLEKALPAILHNFNGNGGWVFRRHEAMTYGHPQMYSPVNESNLFFTWFRLLGLAYCLTGLKKIPEEFRFNWNFKRAPGHQFL